VPDYRKLARAGVVPEKELKKLAEALKIDAGLFGKRADGLPARLLAYHHLVERRGMTQTEAADFFGVSGYAVSKGIKRLKVMAEKDKKLKKLMEISNVQV
jgi:DNA-binding Xre family transcriptional regulator